MNSIFIPRWRIAFFIMASLAGAFASLTPAAADQPNILFIVTDDQGAWAMGCAGNPNAYTPNLDRLRQQGVMLTEFYATSPVCSPARAAMLTSRYGIEIGVTDALSRGGNEPIGLSPDLPTWPRSLKSAGYRTALFGKYHCSAKPESHPTKMGYETFTGFVIGAGESQNPEVEIDGELRRVAGYTSDIITDFAIDFIKQHSGKETGPFAVSVHYWAPHANARSRDGDGGRTWKPLSDADLQPHLNTDVVVPLPDFPGLELAKLKRMYREYMASVTSVDRNVKRLLELLDKLKLTDDTLVIFTSDHGMNMGHHGVWHKGNGEWLVAGRTDKRSNMWDTSLRVPTLMRWPPVIKPGSTIAQTLSHLDWFPTLTDVCGCQRGATGDNQLRGRSFLQLLRGDAQAAANWDNEFYAEYRMQKDRGGGRDDMRSWQNHRWKLVRFVHETRPDEFYDRENDPHEQTNLIDAQDPEIRRAIHELNRRLDDRIREIYGR